MAKDDEHLRLLSIFHYVVGGLCCLFACIPLIHLAIGLFFVIAPDKLQGSGGDAPPAFIGWIFLAVGSILFLVGQSVGICIIVSGRYLARRIKYLYSFILGCIECIFVPFGTALGIFTILVLSRDSVKALYEKDKHL